MSKIFLNKYLFYICFFIFAFSCLVIFSLPAFGQDEGFQEIEANYYFCGERTGLTTEPKDINDLDGDDLLKLNWPSFGEGSLNTITEDSISLSRIVNYFYSFSLWLAVMAGFISIIIVGFTYIRSGSNPTKRKEAVDRAANIFFGIIILLSSVIILNFVNPDLKDLDLCYETGDCRVDIEEAEEIELPKSRFGSALYIKQDYIGAYSGIPYTNFEGAELFYENILYSNQSVSSCFRCEDKNIISYNATETKIIQVEDVSIPCNFYCDGTRDRIKDFLERGCYKNQAHNYRNLYQTDNGNYETADSYIVVEGSEASSPTNCAVACMAVSADKGASCRPIEGGKSFYSWFDNFINNKINSCDEVIQKLDLYRKQYELSFNSCTSIPSNSYLLDFFEDGDNDKIKDRRDFRACIGEKYVLDSQDVAQVGGSVCLCKNQKNE